MPTCVQTNACAKFISISRWPMRRVPKRVQFAKSYFTQSLGSVTAHHRKCLLIPLGPPVGRCLRQIEGRFFSVRHNERPRFVPVSRSYVI